MSQARPLTLGITGSAGFIGWHLRCFFLQDRDVRVLAADRTTFADDQSLQSFVDACDVIVHLAGVNRGTDAEILETNVVLARRLASACDRRSTPPYVIFASSTHVDRGTVYGESKKQAAQHLMEWAARRGVPLCNLILPNVFGEYGRPFYNSVIATFCHQLACGQQPAIKVDATFEYVHCSQIGEQLRVLIAARPSGEVRMAGRPMAVTALLARLREFDALYRSGIVPALTDAFDLSLFNCLRGAMYPAFYPVSPILRTDPRGALFEAVKSHNGGQTFISTTRPGITRGNHYHVHKVERFCVLAGQAVIRLRRLFTGEVVEFAVTGEEPCFIDMPTLHTHNITNTGTQPLVTLFWAHEIFDPERPDTWPEPVTA